MELMTLFMNHHTVCLIFNATLSYSKGNAGTTGAQKIKITQQNPSYLKILSLLWDFTTNLFDQGSLCLLFCTQDGKICFSQSHSF